MAQLLVWEGGYVVEKQVVIVQLAPYPTYAYQEVFAAAAAVVDVAVKGVAVAVVAAAVVASDPDIVLKQRG